MEPTKKNSRIKSILSYLQEDVPEIQQPPDTEGGEEEISPALPPANVTGVNLKKKPKRPLPL